ncbi:MAG: hypothetical protein HWD59_04305 [Coxiellaceae bacterium]|nr:MAG: hypothetical protein HWD59_04305 [Coxiellaceae bacterium]
MNVGKIICLYMGNSKMGFPVALEQKVPQLVPVPAGANWSKDLGGYRQCNSQKVTDCEFVVYKNVRQPIFMKNLSSLKVKKALKKTINYYRHAIKTSITATRKKTIIC